MCNFSNAHLEGYHSRKYSEVQSILSEVWKRNVNQENLMRRKERHYLVPSLPPEVPVSQSQKRQVKSTGASKKVIFPVLAIWCQKSSCRCWLISYNNYPEVAEETKVIVALRQFRCFISLCNFLFKYCKSKIFLKTMYYLTLYLLINPFFWVIWQPARTVSLQNSSPYY